MVILKYCKGCQKETYHSKTGKCFSCGYNEIKESSNSYLRKRYCKFCARKTYFDKQNICIECNKEYEEQLRYLEEKVEDKKDYCDFCKKETGFYKNICLNCLHEK